LVHGANDDLSAGRDEAGARGQGEGRTESEIVRESLAGTLRGDGRTIKDLRFGMFDSGRTDTSTRVDEVLAETGFGTS
jgi:hypothetical protein